MTPWDKERAPRIKNIFQEREGRRISNERMRKIKQ
jgi:hypothetical protein